MAWWPDSRGAQLPRAGDAGADEGRMGTEPWVSAGAGRQSPQGGRVVMPQASCPIQPSTPIKLPSSLLQFYFHPSTQHQ